MAYLYCFAKVNLLRCRHCAEVLDTLMGATGVETSGGIKREGCQRCKDDDRKTGKEPPDLSGT